MNTENIHQSGKPDRNASCWCLFAAACIVFLYIAFNSYTRFLHEHLLIVPCLLFLGTRLEHRDGNRRGRLPLLSVMMLVWYIILNVKRSAESTQIGNIPLFLSTYLFALPLASLLQDGDKKKALKLFAGAYLAASGILTAAGLLLILGWVPGFLSEQIYWDGARLHTFWHSNIAACFFMIGIAFAAVFLVQSRKHVVKVLLAVAIVLQFAAMALTNCRTTLLLTSALFGGILFFKIFKGN